MSAKANYFKIGVFVISAAIIAIIAIIALGAGSFFKKKVLMETYMDGSVQGLDVGSPLKFRGVQIGNVEEITFVADKYDLDSAGKNFLTYSNYVYIRASFEPHERGLDDEAKLHDRLEDMIDRGLRVRLASQGITGVAFLQVDFLDPETYPPLDIGWKPRTHYLPSAPSMFTRITETLQKIIDKAEEINVERITEGLESTLDAVSNTLADLNVKKLSKELEELLATLNKRAGPLLSETSETMSSVKKLVEDTKKPLTQSIGELPEIVAQLKRTLRKLNNIVSSDEENIVMSTENVRVITGNLRDLTENARRYPSFLLFGDPPPRSYPGGIQQ
jgi:phospholipid/cholesterol/gamma-HCH transport system substrate-binding protein/paraquat-inducible protein B